MPANLTATSDRAFDSVVPAKIATVLVSSRALSAPVSALALGGVITLSRPAAGTNDSSRRRLMSTEGSSVRGSPDGRSQTNADGYGKRLPTLEAGGWTNCARLGGRGDRQAGGLAGLGDPVWPHRR